MVRRTSEISILLVEWCSGEKRPAGAELAAWVRVSSPSQIFHHKLQRYNDGITKCLTRYNASYNGGITDMAMSNAERQRRWLAKNRAAFNLRRRNARKSSSLGEKEAAVESNRSRTEMARSEILGRESSDALSSNVDGGSNAPPPQFTTKKVGEFRMVVLPEEKPTTDAPVSTDTRSRSDIAMGIWRNDQGGVISKFAWDKLQKLKKEAKDGGYEIDQYSQ